MVKPTSHKSYLPGLYCSKDSPEVKKKKNQKKIEGQVGPYWIIKQNKSDQKKYYGAKLMLRRAG